MKPIEDWTPVKISTWALWFSVITAAIVVVLGGAKWMEEKSPCDEVCRGSDVLWCKTSPEGKQAACQVDDNTVCMRMTFGFNREFCAPRKRGAPVK